MYALWCTGTLLKPSPKAGSAMSPRPYHQLVMERVVERGRGKSCAKSRVASALVKSRWEFAGKTQQSHFGACCVKGLCC